MRVRYGYRRICVLLHREGWAVNARRVDRLYKLEGLTMRHKPPRRRVAAMVRDDRTPATGPKRVWAMEGMYEGLFDGRRIWVLTVVDTWSRICPVLRVCRTATALEVTSALDEAVRRFGAPWVIRVDQGCQFPSREIDLWAYLKGVELNFSRPGKPTDNAATETFNARVRAEGLDHAWFWTTPAERWRIGRWSTTK